MHIITADCVLLVYIGIVAVSCSESVAYEDRIDLSSSLLKDRSLVLIWSFADPIHPVLFLEGPESVQCFKLVGLLLYLIHFTIMF